MNRRVFMDKLGITESTLRSFEKQGIVNAIKRDGRGWALYDEACVDKARNALETLQKPRSAAEPRRSDARLLPSLKEWNVAYSTDEALLVLDMLKAGKPMLDVILEAKMHPAVVRAIAKEYEIVTRTMFVPGTVIAAIEAIPVPRPLTEPIKTAEDFGALVEQIVATYAQPRCGACKRRAATHCAACRLKPAADPDPDAIDAKEPPP